MFCEHNKRSDHGKISAGWQVCTHSTQESLILIPVKARPVTFFMEYVSSDPGDGTIKSVYKQAYENCTYDPISSPRKIEEIRVFSTRFDPDIRKVRVLFLIFGFLN